MARARTIAAGLLVVTLMLSFTPMARALAQERQQPNGQATEAGKQAAQAENQRQGAKEGNGEAADPNEVFKHSDSVKLIARKTGLSLDTVYWICVVLNFIAVFAILWILLGKMLPTVFRNRGEAIKKRLEEAKNAADEARQRLSDVEARLSRLDMEIEQMRREAEAGARLEEERVMAAAEEERRRIVESAEQEIDRAASSARRELKAYAAELAVNLAEQKIRISGGTDEMLVRDFASRLGKDSH